MKSIFMIEQFTQLSFGPLLFLAPDLIQTGHCRTLSKATSIVAVSEVILVERNSEVKESVTLIF
jgi:hypothetical protein